MTNQRINESTKMHEDKEINTYRNLMPVPDRFEAAEREAREGGLIGEVGSA